MASIGTLGVVILAMYGDRTPYYQNPYTYEQSYTKLTPLGQTQETQLGSYLRREYLNPASPNSIDNFSYEIVDDRQILVHADNGGEGGAIVDSAVALLQGLFPPTPRSRTHLANGSVVTGPLGGYQYVPVVSVEPEQSIQLEGWSSCPNFDKHIRNFYDSSGFRKAAQDAAPFLRAVRPYLFGIPNNLENMWNIYDYIHTNYIHNETYAFRLPPTFLQQARAWVNYHEHGIFSDESPTGIGNVAGRTILPSLVTAMERIADKSDPLTLSISEISYKPFISLLKLAGVADRYPHLRSLPSYGSAVAFELRNNEDGETHIRTRIKNGTGDFETVHMFSHRGDIALNELLYRLDLYAIDSIPQWCRVCGQTTERGCNLCPVDVVPTLPVQTQSADGIMNSIVELLGSPAARASVVVWLACLATFSTVRMFRRARREKVRLLGEENTLERNNQYYDATKKTPANRY